MRSASIVLALLLTACGSDTADDAIDTVPTCSRAVSSFYGAGCTFVDGDRAVPQAEMRAYCERWYDELPARCGDELDAWMICLDDAAAPACDCAAEQADVLAC